MHEHTDALGLAAAKVATYGGGVSAFFFGLSANETAALAGVVIALVGLVVQWHYNRKRDRRETEYHMLRLERLRDDDP